MGAPRLHQGRMRVHLHVLRRGATGERAVSQGARAASKILDARARVRQRSELSRSACNSKTLKVTTISLSEFKFA